MASTSACRHRSTRSSSTRWLPPRPMVCTPSKWEQRHSRRPRRTPAVAMRPPILQAANVSIANGILALYRAGARNFMVWRVPNAALPPAIRALDQVNRRCAVGDGAREGSAQVLTASSQLSALPESGSCGSMRIDAERPVADPGVWSDECHDGLRYAQRSPFACDRPDEYLFWDGIHPSRAVHAITAQEAAANADALTVPSPEADGRAGGLHRAARPPHPCAAYCGGGHTSKSRSGHRRAWPRSPASTVRSKRRHHFPAHGRLGTTLRRPCRRASCTRCRIGHLRRMR
jgi:hypothetical protein